MREGFDSLDSRLERGLRQILLIAFVTSFGYQLRLTARR